MKKVTIAYIYRALNNNIKIIKQFIITLHNFLFCNATRHCNDIGI